LEDNNFWCMSPFERNHARLCLVKLGNNILPDDALLLIYATKPSGF
jgi:hypothetical protein